MEDTWQPVLEGRSKPAEVGKKVISGKVGINLSPSVSPDGTYIVYFSRRDVFTLDLFLACTETGQVVDKLVSANSDAHFDALRFMESSGTWSPDGKQPCFVIFEKGDNRLAILDVESGEVTSKFPVRGVEAIHNIAWSPQGGRLAVSANSGSSSDLYIYHLGTGRTDRITRDRFAELQPAWSPDGRKIAFVTDRGSATEMERLDFGPVVIGLMDLETKNIDLISIAGAEKNINPQSSPEGQYIYFVADPGGVSDIFRYRIKDGKMARLTRIATGISSLTNLSPVLSVAGQSGDLFFNVFHDMGYHIHSIPASRIEETGEHSCPSHAYREVSEGFGK